MINNGWTKLIDELRAEIVELKAFIRNDDEIYQKYLTNRQEAK